jgi:hypothetical protein
VQKRIHPFVGNHPHIAAAPAIATGWTTTRHKLFATKRRHAVPAVACDYANFCSIDEHFPTISDFKSQFEISLPEN